MTTDQIVSIVTSILPTIILVVGGQFLLNRYEIIRKSKEQEIELVRSVREKQYAAVESLYGSFAKFMALYRLINDKNTNLENQKIRDELLQKAIQAESEIDALILRIGCEFAQHDTEQVLESLLGHLRQSVQLWRESIRSGEKLPFWSSEQEDYVRFKETFAATAAFMVHQIQNRLEPPKMRMDETKSILMNAFSNKYEFEKYKSTAKIK
jgi:hypothetical protein